MYRKIAEMRNGEYVEHWINMGPTHPQLQDDKEDEVMRHKLPLVDSITRVIRNDYNEEGLAHRGAKVA